MFVLYADKNKLAVRQKEPVTSGSVNVYDARFEFSGDWVGMERVAVFLAGGESVSVMLDDHNQCTVPWEVLKSPNVKLSCGIYGTQGGTTVLPTVWADLGWVLPGAELGSESRPPTPELWKQELARKGDALRYDGLNLSLMSQKTKLSTVPITGGSGSVYGVGHGLKLVDGDLTVDAVDDFAGDRTLPMTAAGVQTVVGNIEVLLGTI